MPPLTLQEVVERINKAMLPPKEPESERIARTNPTPPRSLPSTLTWRLANFFFNA